MADPMTELLRFIQLDLNDSDYDEYENSNDNADESPAGTGLEVGVNRDQDVEERATEEEVEEEHDSVKTDAVTVRIASRKDKGTDPVYQHLDLSALEENSIVTLPLMPYHEILVPGQVISLNLYAKTVADLKRQAPDTKTIFAMLSRFKFGCTAEFISMKDEREGWTGLDMVVAQARGCQRFQVISHSTSRRTPRAKVRILPELSCSHSLSGVQVASLRKCLPPSLENRDDRIKPHITRLFAAHFARWPQWVYKLYDIDWLSQQLRLELQSLFPETLPKDSLELSRWFISNAVIGIELSTLLFSFDSVVQRLRYSLSIVRKSRVTLHCDSCRAEICSKKELFNMGQDGPLVTFVNPDGQAHEILTVLSALHVKNDGDASTEHSCFPGYAWTPILCDSGFCMPCLGWMFTSTVPSLSPQKFWGLRHSAIRITFSKRDGKDKEQMAELMYTT